METIEQAQNRLESLSMAGKNGFFRGVLWSNSWIDIDEEVPTNQDLVLVKTDLGSVSTAYKHGKNSGFITYGEDAFVEFGNITHWRPIERL
jgi:hypothetical protein